MAPHRAQNLNPEAICAAVSALQLGSSDPFVDGEFRGGECRIFKVSFKEDLSLSVRVNHPADGDQQDIIDHVNMETRFFRSLEAKAFPWSPRYRAASLTFDNPINYPFMVLDWAEGAPLKWDDNFPLQPIRDILLAQLAEIQLSLVTCTMENRCTTATEFFERRIRNQLKRVKDGKLPGLVEKDCLDQLTLLPKVLGRDGHSRAFAVDHGDLKPANIIVDQENNIKCIIDWGFAAMVPIVQAAKLPCFLWTDDSATRVPSQAMLKDRQSYINSIPTQESQAALYMKRWQDVKDVDFRMLYLESISSKGMLASMASVGWKLSYCDLVEEI
ncbi:Protein kinase-like protein [Cordyceps javanica]|uniref:Protein kinase-like protein n=1 Tax=Cordyceps javanica TaxID=43265 RepID=A0A545VXV2_9HYPO|nr:Protein kinase-like protein [Cordyceps javanica]TQW06542.1 Protein kinase-like protein [Cordyceps javanica]